jgi:hypothetical protein
MNGRTSAGPKSRHIDILRYFWLKDRVKSGDITIRHCPTFQMLADFFTKPLQGNLFRCFKAVVLGHQHVDTLRETIAELLEERVEDKRSATSKQYSQTGMQHSNKSCHHAYVAKTPSQHTLNNNKIISGAHSLERIPYV